MLKISKPSLKDLPQLLPLWEDCQRYHFSLDKSCYKPLTQKLVKEIKSYLLKLIKNRKLHLRQARWGKKCVGYIVFERRRKDYFDTDIKHFGQIEELFVRKNFRKRGVGKALVAYAEKYFKDRGEHCFIIHSSIYNQNGNSFYSRIGYKKRSIIFDKKIS